MAVGGLHCGPVEAGTAYGLMTMIQNIGLSGLNLLVGWANDYSHAGARESPGYRLGMWIFSSWASWE